MKTLKHPNLRRTHKYYKEQLKIIRQSTFLMFWRSFIYSNTQLHQILFFSTNEAGSNTNKNTTLSLTIGNASQRQFLWILSKRNSNEIETFISYIGKDLFQDASRKRILSNLLKDEKKALKDWRKNVLFNGDSDQVMRLQNNGNRLIIVDKQTDHEKARGRLKGVLF